MSHYIHFNAFFFKKIKTVLINVLCLFSYNIKKFKKTLHLKFDN